MKIDIKCSCGHEFHMDTGPGGSYTRPMEMAAEFNESHKHCPPADQPVNNYYTEEKIVWQHFAIGDKISFASPGHAPREYVIVDATPYMTSTSSDPNIEYVCQQTLTLQPEELAKR